MLREEHSMTIAEESSENPKVFTEQNQSLIPQKPINKGGRPTTEERLAKRAGAAEVLDGVDQSRMWKRFLESKDERIALDCWKYLNDRVYGKPAQAVDVTDNEDRITTIIVDI